MASKSSLKDAKQLADAMRKTLNLPTTTFSMRANAIQREPQLHARCVTQVYQQQQQASAQGNGELFVLHDGPPFANGSLHMGHFLNKVLKDIIKRYKLLRGYQLDYVPGWDCHGLPIEIKALEALKSKSNSKSKSKSKSKAKSKQQDASQQEVHAVDQSQLTPMQVRALCRQLASNAIQDQKRDFMRWGILADWEHEDYYVTMDPAYEAQQYDILKQMVQDELVYRGFKPVFWSPSSQTALAEAELEYTDNHISHAAYIRFPLHQAASKEFQSLANQYGGKDKLQCVIWTTTPWTIPANMALCVNEKLEYSIAKVQNSDEYWIIATQLLATLPDQAKEALETNHTSNDVVVLATFPGSWLHKSEFSHPLFDDRKSVMLLGDHVTLDAGTGVVHTAPGHGQDDYFAWTSFMQEQDRTQAPEIVCPVNERGIFTAAAGPELVGLEVLNKGNRRVLEMLESNGRLVHTHKYSHRYPYDWRTKKPVILRATAQWFAKLDGLHELGKQVVQDQVQMVPSSSRNRLEATLSSRHEWCISRQRAWGLPIPVFYHKETQEPLINAATISHLQKLIRQTAANQLNKPNGDDEPVPLGSDLWWHLPVEQLLPEEYADVAHEYVKGTDTLDVWFDSGSSWYTVLKDSVKTKANGFKKQADVYLEGSDQHRGWFQSSLLTSLAMQQCAPYKTLVTHGFALDERGTKMSKSLGNTVVPNDFIHGSHLRVNNSNKKVVVPPYGVDVLRFWVASTDYTNDVSIGPSVIAKVSDNLRKVRNTARFLLGNLHDFDFERDQVPYDQLSASVDKYLLHVLGEVNAQVTSHYDQFAFQKVQQTIAHFIANDLSAFYMEACKDRLYCDAADSSSRRSVQTVLWIVLQSLTKAIAPVVCHTAEDIRLHAEAQRLGCKPDEVPGSIFLADRTWLPMETRWSDPKRAGKWQFLRDLKIEVNRLVEQMRADGIVGSQLECRVELFSDDDEVVQLIQSACESGLENVFLCSQVQLVDDQETNPACYHAQCNLVLDQEKKLLQVVVSKARGHKCPRCWKYAPEVDEAETKLCARCVVATGLESTLELATRLAQE